MSESIFQQAMNCHQRGEWVEAERLYLSVLAQAPTHAFCLGNLGNLLIQQGRLDEGFAAYERALRAAPLMASLHFNLGTALMFRSHFAAAEAPLRRALELAPGYLEAHNNLGIVLRRLGRCDEAAAAFREVLRRHPADVFAQDNLGNVLMESGQMEEAVACFQRALALAPANHLIHSNLLFGQLYHSDYDAGRLHAELRRWRERFADPLKPEITPHVNDRSPERPLRLGFLSPNFRDHVVGRNLIPLFRNLDRACFQAICYSDVLAPDALTEEFRRHAAQFLTVAGMPDALLARRIRDDRIDILVDLTLHMPCHRLLVMARKPAPVQVTWAGYPGSTGLDVIDYRLTDSCLDPPGQHDEWYAEKSFRLPATFWCYDPLDNAHLPVGTLPASTSGHITFGCLNNFCKVNDRTLQLWARTMNEVPGSHLLLLAEPGPHQQRTLDLLASLGVAPQRVHMAGKRRRREYLEFYHQIDLGLDTLPYNGHTTTLDSLYMGVPVVTLVGSTVVGRAGLSQLTNLGLPELIAQTEPEFIALARDLAHDRARLAQLRAGLRQRMQRSPLMDAPRFAQGIQDAFRQMWRRWCDAPPTAAPASGPSATTHTPS